MKKIFFGVIYCILLSISFNSCTIEKRVYQDGYHFTWKHHRSDFFDQSQLLKISTPKEKKEDVIPNQCTLNVHSATSLSASSSEEPELILATKKTIHSNLNADTIVPTDQKQQEEYYRNSYSEPIQNKKNSDVNLANWALGLGIGAFTSPLWLWLLFLLIFSIIGASWATVSIWTVLGLTILVGGGIFITLDVLAITFAIRYLRKYGKNPYFRKYRNRAITALVFAGIYPAIMLLNIILSAALI